MGDTNRLIDLVLRQGSPAVPVSLTGATVLFRYKVGATLTSRTMTLDATKQGRAYYTLVAGDFTLFAAAGSYDFDVKVTFGSGLVLYFPSYGNGKLNVTAPLS